MYLKKGFERKQLRERKTIEQLEKSRIISQNNETVEYRFFRVIVSMSETAIETQAN